MHKLKHYTAKIMYITTWPLWQIFFRIFLNYRVIYEDKSIKNLKRNKAVLIVSNHVTYLDPFLVGAVFPINSRVYPIRWLTKAKVFSFPIAGLFVRLYGSLRVERGIGIENSLKEAINILKKGGSVGIFPEGRLIKNRKLSKAKRGVAYLACKTDPLIIPVRIDGMENITIKEIITRKRAVTIYVGKSFRIPKECEKLEEMSASIMQRVHNLK
ncbi:MAG: lysophospholipid acyltransferase family protein [Candidatus Spechtbacterales bacterium]|nr:lysophospholipid acyltransferase family protein [Candidatus Spechtbacterales bacterium]